MSSHEQADRPRGDRPHEDPTGDEPSAPEPAAEPTPEPTPELGAGVDAPDRPWRDLLRAALTPTRRQVVVAVVLALVGYAVVVQVRANDVDSGYESLRQQDLIDVLNGLSGTTQRAQTEIRSLTRTRDDLRDDTSGRRAALEQARDEVDTLSILAGLVPVTGPGIRVTITEVDGTVRLSSVLDLVQELRTVGAEAIAVNGEVRVVAQTAFEDAAGGLEIDGELVESPYVVDVIGDPGVLAGAVDFTLGPRSQLENDGADVRVQQLGSLDIEAVRPGPQPDYAVPQPDQ